MKYEITTLQYGIYKDVYVHNDIDSLFNDLANISEMETVEILSIVENGNPLPSSCIEHFLSLVRDPDSFSSIIRSEQ